MIERQAIAVYIVYMGALPSKASYTPMSHHHNILQEVVKSSSVEDSLVRSYGRSFNGFAVKLTESERDNLAGMEGVVSVFPSTFYKLLTTRSYEFMGLGDKSKQVPEVETNTIVGVIDGGIWPESKSFSDEGIGPIPKKWKGTCAGGTNFTCNKKVIGARHYVQDSARDDDGHGSHTASTAAGNKVKGVSVNGVAKGTARGGVPLGRVAVYKVCEPAGCNAEGILAAFDDAIADGVDVITISMGGGVTKVDVDPIAIGSFHAMTKGIVTTVAVGNDGSKLGLASNLAPWLISVAAGTTDRRFVTDVVNGDGKTLHYEYREDRSMTLTCPHVAGVAAYVKTFHPDWSASAVKSAIMTTAWAMNASKNAEGEFAYGSGHVNPTVAVDPGLVYDIAKEDYLNMLCSFDYSAKGISTLAGGDFTCSEKSKLTMRNLNYPSMTAKVSASSSSSDITFSRTVTNVGRNISTYKAKLTGNPKLSITVEPQTLSFKSSWEKKSFTVTVSGKSLAQISGIVSASLVWSDGTHNVRSPIVVYT
ncbi:hypothetical protein DY000_02039198 [Brassica cretica]|uniref:Subtilisin-like protease n=1 Tax=Brassica cretica TaxID=69181 RepID=A0ABQ7BBA0_BRACR|nr:hypothetical protein DY000_02039198 [Brassica cretica]